jgi:hypothetical protein
MMTLEQLRKLVFALPETSERLIYNATMIGFYVQQKMMVCVREDRISIAIKTTDLEREALSQLEPETFSVPPHYQKYPYMVVQLERVDSTELEQLLESAWNQVASKKLRATRVNP